MQTLRAPLLTRENCPCQSGYLKESSDHIIISERKEIAVSEKAPASSRWWTLAAVSAATFMLMLDITVINVALPDVRASLHASFTDLQWVLDAYSLTLAVFLLTAGSLADLWGRKRVFVAGFAAFTVASLTAGLAGDILALNLSRAAEGVGAAILYAVGPALIGHEFRGKERGLAFGVFGAISGLAIAIGPLIGGALTESLGWRWIFLINGAGRDRRDGSHQVAGARVA
jgi:MFS family permease